MMNWVEHVGANVVASLAKESDVELTSNIITLLEKFGECVENESRTRRLHQRKIERVEHELANTNTAVRHEVELMHRSIAATLSTDNFSLRVHRHAETCLPIVHASFMSFPTLVIHVTRQYAAKKGVTFGIRTARGAGRRLTGQLASAANYLTEACRTQKWNISVADVIHVWFTSLSTISAGEGEQAAQPNLRKRPGSLREYGRWKARKVTISKSGKESNTPGRTGQTGQTGQITTESDGSSPAETKGCGTGDDSHSKQRNEATKAISNAQDATQPAAASTDA